MITTRAIIAEEQAIVNGVKGGMGKKAALIAEAEYRTPDELRITYDGLARLLADARRRGEEITSELAALWLQQHEAVNKYVMTSTDQFLNIRGGAGVGKTYFMERLVRASIDAGRPAALVAPYETKPGDAAVRSRKGMQTGCGGGLSRCQYGCVALEQNAF